MRRLALIVLLGTLAGCGAEAAPQDRPPLAGQTRFEDRLHGLTVTFPSDWHRARRSLTPALGEPQEVLSLGTYPLRRGPDGNCGHLPVQAVRDIGDDDVLISVQERRAPQGFRARPRPFRLPRPHRGDAEACARRPDAVSYWTDFRDGARGFYVLVVTGRHASPARRRQAEAILSSLRFDPLRERNGVRGLPPRGWRLHEGQLATLDGEVLALSSYPIPRRDPRDCSPRAALKAMPPDGALLYLFEYRDLDATQMRRFPRFRPPVLRLRPRERRSYECFGDSWLVLWQDHGRALQLHAHLGPRAGARRRAELRKAYRSLVVERSRE